MHYKLCEVILVLLSGSRSYDVSGIMSYFKLPCEEKSSNLLFRDLKTEIIMYILVFFKFYIGLTNMNLGTIFLCLTCLNTYLYPRKWEFKK